MITKFNESINTPTLKLTILNDINDSLDINNYQDLGDINNYQDLDSFDQLNKYKKNDSIKSQEKACRNTQKKSYKIKNEHKSIKSVKENGSNLQHVRNQTDKICLEAVKNDGLALFWVEVYLPGC